ncbi:MAG: universal stress protein [Anaerolineae bacterium]|nr:universal stress protein [Anaerolineae bacterium]MDW8072459.1 universal stress protein [Anaerolineae bacterium]
MFKKLLVPVDGSPYANRAVDMAVGLAKCCGSSIMLVHVIRDLSLPREILEMIASGEITAGRLQLLKDSAAIILDNAAERCRQGGIREVSQECLMGDPAGKILEYAAQNGVDLIVLGQRGLQPHSDLLGSVARKLVNTTTIPCLVVT